MEATVSEIHRYPLRPPGFVEPLFETAESRREVVEHLLGASWLCRASELSEEAGTAAHARGEPVELRRRAGVVEIVRPWDGRRELRWERRRVVEVVARWREVRRWWAEDGVDRLLFRVSVAGSAVVDLARERSGGWLLVSVVD